MIFNKRGVGRELFTLRESDNCFDKSRREKRDGGRGCLKGYDLCFLNDCGILRFGFEPVCCLYFSSVDND